MEELPIHKVESCGWSKLPEKLNDLKTLEFYRLHTVTEVADGSSTLYTLIWELREVRDPDAPTD
jgi:hypothetical protein